MSYDVKQAVEDLVFDTGLGETCEAIVEAKLRAAYVAGLREAAEIARGHRRQLIAQGRAAQTEESVSEITAAAVACGELATAIAAAADAAGRGGAG